MNKKLNIALSLLALASFLLAACNGAVQDTVQNSVETAIAPVYQATSALFESPTPTQVITPTPAPIFTPPAGYNWVGTLVPGASCTTRLDGTGIEVSNQGQEDGVTTVLISLSGELKMLTNDSPTYVDGFIFVLADGGDVEVYAPSGRLCLWGQ